MFITSYHLLARPELVPQACPRDTVSSIIAPLLARCRAAEGADEAVLAGCRYLEYLWYCTRDHRTLEWCINDGIFTVALYLASSSDLDDEQTVNELTSVFRMMYRCFVHWRVLYVFERKHAEDLTARRIAEGMNEGLVELIDAFHSRRKALHTAQNAWETRFLKTCHSPPCSNIMQRKSCRTCTCREVLYCSKACQKRHWEQGGAGFAENDRGSKFFVDRLPLPPSPFT